MDYYLKSSDGDAAPKTGGGHSHAAYIEYLLQRLTDFRAAGQERYKQKFSGGNTVRITRRIIVSQLKPLGLTLHQSADFDAVCQFIQGKIAGTILGQRNARMGRPSWHSFAEHGQPKAGAAHKISEAQSNTAPVINQSNSPVLTVRNENDAPAESNTASASESFSMTAPCGHAVGDRVTGSSAPGQHRASDSRELSVSGNEQNDAATSDAAVDATQAVQSMPATCGSTSPASALPLTENQYKQAADRRLVLTAARKLFAAKNEAGLSISPSIVKVAKACGVKTGYLWNLLQLAPAVDAAGNPVRSYEEKCTVLINAPTEKLAPAKPPGKDSDFAILLELPEITGEINRLYAATMGASGAQATNDRRTGSIATTLCRLGDHPTVPLHLATKLRAGSKPKCLVDFIKTTWTPEMEAKFRGQKHYSTSTIAGRRELKEELADGTTVALQPGRVWVFDDMSSNIPFWFEVDAADITDEILRDKNLSQLIRRHGCALGRQGLYAWDWASGAWLGLELVGRLRDAYQASDILRFIRKLVSVYGKPEKIIMEKGVWMSRAISGWIIKELAGEGILCEIEDAWTVAEMPADETAQISAGIRAIGVEIIHTHTPRGKPIEGAFNHHQRLVPTFLNPGEAVNIGRHAGEFEWSARQHRRAQAGVLHPSELGFIHIDRLADVSWQAMLWEGNHVKNSRGGKPTEILTQYLQNFPLPVVTERDLAVFLPDKRNTLLIDGVLTAQLDGKQHQFLNPEVFAALGDGVRLDWAWDPAEPTLGAAVYNRQGFLCWANYLPPGPVISARDRSQEPAVQLIKRYKLAHRTAARMIDFRTLRTVRTAERRDGAGQVATVRTGGDVQTPAAETGGRGARTAVPVRELEQRQQETRELTRLADEALANLAD